MREISAYTILGGILATLTERHSVDSIKYETAKDIIDAVISKVNKSAQNYLLLPMQKKMDIVKSMIGKGVFKTDHTNKITPFKQVYNYEVAKSICATYSCNGSLTFKFPKLAEDDPALNAIKSSYTQNLPLDIQTALSTEITGSLPKIKLFKSKGKE